MPITAEHLPEDLRRIDVRDAGYATACWLWEGSRNGPYGTVHRDKNYRVHRVAYEAAVGPIPAGLGIDHLCRNPLCINPEHLEAVTNSENTARMNAVANCHRRKTHCPQGHAYVSGNIYLYGKNRQCRTCKIEQNRERRKAA